jgi:hypothetical protein
MTNFSQHSLGDPWGIKYTEEVTIWRDYDSCNIARYDDWSKLFFELLGCKLGLPEHLRGKVYPIHDLSDLFFSRVSPRAASDSFIEYALSGTAHICMEVEVRQFVSFQMSQLYQSLLTMMATGVMEHCCATDLKFESAAQHQLVCFSTGFLEREFAKLLFGVERDDYGKWRELQADDVDRINSHIKKSMELMTGGYMFVMVENPETMELDDICQLLGLTTGIVREYSRHVLTLNLSGIEDSTHIATAASRIKLNQGQHEEMIERNLDKFSTLIQLGEPESLTAFLTLRQVYTNFQQSGKASMLPF